MSLLELLTLLAALGSGVVAGIFFAFSTFVMQALARLPQRCGIEAMQAINITVINPWFFSAFFGTAALCVAVSLFGFADSSGSRRLLLLGGSVLYLVGTIFVTLSLNVPLNNQLAVADPDSQEGHVLWQHYLSRWTLWNTVRTIAALLAAGLFVLAY